MMAPKSDPGKMIQVIRSSRKTFALQIKPDGQVILRAPLRASRQQLNDFVKEHEDWLNRNLKKIALQQKEEELSGRTLLTQEEIKNLAEQAASVLPAKAAYYAPLVGVTYGRITIRCQKTRWGSCSAAGNLNFNCLIMLMPDQVIDSIVVHELCHRLEMNHSARFYREVYRVFPEYDSCRKWLKENGNAIMRRAGW